MGAGDISSARVRGGIEGSCTLGLPPIKNRAKDWTLIAADGLDFKALERFLNLFRVEEDRPMPDSEKWNLSGDHERPQGPDA